MEIMNTKQAIISSIFWLVISLCFSCYLFHTQGNIVGSSFLTVYLIEKLLSLDNLFVFLLVFNYFNTPNEYKWKILNYGIIGAFTFRAIFIYGGLEVIDHISFILYGLGLLLLYLGIKMFIGEEDCPDDVSKSIAFRVSNKLFNVEPTYNEGKFFTKTGLSMMFLVAVIIELSDIIFAVDSVPASFAFTTDASTIYLANIFAIIGLRSLFFLVDALSKKLIYLNYGLGIILGFIGTRILIKHWIEISTLQSLSFVVVVLSVTTLVSLKGTKYEVTPSNGKKLS